MGVSLSPKGTGRTHGENRMNREYKKKNPNKITKISLHLKGQDIMEEYLKCIKEN